MRWSSHRGLEVCGMDGGWGGGNFEGGEDGGGFGGAADDNGALFHGFLGVFDLEDAALGGAVVIYPVS